MRRCCRWRRCASCRPTTRACQAPSTRSGRALSRDGWLFRYRLDDGFGQPTVAFIICTFWLVEALAAIGRMEEAKAVMDRIHAALSPLGLLSEDYETSEPAHVGQLPAGLLARRPDPRGLRRVAALGGNTLRTSFSRV